MTLTEVINHPYSSRYYLERYVNDGSPSGFSVVNTTNAKTSPFELNPWFHLWVCIAPKRFFKDYGTIPDVDIIDCPEECSWIFVHPDMCDNPFFNNINFTLYKFTLCKALPTASGRTIQLMYSNEDYIKLHYDGVLGRIWRSLPYKKAISGPETSNIIQAAIKNKLLDHRLTILPETGARVLINVDNTGAEEWGMVWRENKPFNIDNDKYHFLFPCFSLFSTDRLKNYHYPLLKQIIDTYNYHGESYILDTIIFPLVKCYFDLITKLGLQPELNAQNLLLGFNEDFSICTFVLRDLESVDKDITVMKTLGMDCSFESYPYKCIQKSDYNYTIKHSFMFDFKLGESVLEPIILLIEKYYSGDANNMRTKIKDYMEHFIEELPEDFFPRNKWFKFENILVDQTKDERPYIELTNPKFRHK